MEISRPLVCLGKHALAITRLHTSAGRSVQAPPFEFQRTEVVHCCRRGSLCFSKGGRGLSRRPPGSLILNTFSTNPHPPTPPKGRRPHMGSGSSMRPCGVSAAFASVWSGALAIESLRTDCNSRSKWAIKAKCALSLELHCPPPRCWPLTQLLIKLANVAPPPPPPPLAILKIMKSY